MTSYANKLTRFYTTLALPTGLPQGIEVLYPFHDPLVRKLVKTFFDKYYQDDHPRHLVLGINPGRFGAGTTGINFTAPRQLKKYLEIDHPFKDQSELSAEFIYEMIERYGGPRKFYSDYFIGSISPLGFTKKGVNLNYYDDPNLLRELQPFIASGIRKLISFGFLRDRCYCIGGDKNYSFLCRLNEKENFFQEIIALPHPRFIMQYRRKKLEDFITIYLNALK